MIKVFTLLLFLIVLLSADAQTLTNNRCGVTQTEDVSQFEHWLGLKRAASARKSLTGYKVPVVVHIIHTGETIGEGFNYSVERIASQIRTLNEDFRRKEGTPGFNSHPDGADTQIEFALAQIDPQGNKTNGIVRVDRNLVNPPTGITDFLTLSSSYSYWNPDQYLNIWCWDIGLHGIYAGKSRFPVSDLEGLPSEEEPGADGIFINAINFGQGDTNTLPNLDMGRTLTHEMGHFLGLLHTFGPPGSCDYSDYCNDTPPVSSASSGCSSQKPLACDGRPAMIENYMDYSYDRCMNIFTKDQAARMQVVIENSPRRKTLLTSDVIDREVVTKVQDVAQPIRIFPNPATDKLYILVDEKFAELDIAVTARTLSGQTVFKNVIRTTGRQIEIPVTNVADELIVLTIESPGLFHRQLVMINCDR